MRHVMRFLIVACGLVALTAAALADTCTVAGTTRTCDFVCGFPSSQANPCQAINNDINGDGFKTTCGSTSGGNFIKGSNNDEVLCGRDGDDNIEASGGNDQINTAGGNDTVDAGSGNDIVEGGTGSDNLVGGSGNDTIYAISSSDFSTNDGGNVIDGGNNDDTIWGAGGDDDIFAGSGDDLIIGQGGRDVIKGEAGADAIINNYGGSTANDVLGSLLCGGTGDDFIYADGPGHQCVDAGTQQAIAGTEFDCQYLNLPADSDDHDIGTQRNCVHPDSNFSSTRHPSCGCD